MKNSFSDSPVAINHQGKAIYFSAAKDRDNATVIYKYNILNLKVDSPDDNGWQGKLTLSFPEETAMMGINILRVPQTINTTDYFQVVTDQEYIYLIRSHENILYLNRYLMVQKEKADVQTDAQYELQPSWEVRFQRSGKPDTPLSKKDTQSFLNLDGKNFVEPIYILPLGTANGYVNLGNGKFSAELLPTGVQGELRWQFILVNEEDGCLYSYSFARTQNGWISLEDVPFSGEKKILLPNRVMRLTLEEENFTVQGIPEAVVYNKQEAVRTADNNRLQMQRSYRYLLTVQGKSTNGKVSLATIDSAISKDGIPAFFDGNGTLLTIQLGTIQPAGFCLHFDNKAYLTIPSGEKPLILDSSFTIQLWIYPEENNEGKNYILGPDTGTQEKDYPPLLWITNKYQIGMGFGNGTKFLSTQTENNVLVNDKWNNVAVIFCQGEYKIYINGKEQALSPEGDVFKDQQPTAKPINRIGFESGSFRGDLDEVRIWSGNQLAKVTEFLYKELPGKETADSALLAYWKLNEGSGTRAYNGASTYPGRDAILEGPIWKDSSCPAVPPTFNTLTDDQGLTLEAGLLTAEMNNLQSFNLFGDMQPGTRPCLLSSYDGMIHLYYQGAKQRFLAAQYNTNIARAVTALNWGAGDPLNDNYLHGTILFASRQPGTIMNNSTAVIKKTEENSYSLQLSDGLSASEKWQGMLPRADYILSVVGGQYVTDPVDLKSQEEKFVFYDESGAYNIAFMHMGNPRLERYMLYISNQTDHFVVQTITIEAETTSNYLSVKITGPIDPQNPQAGTFVSGWKNVPSNASLFTAVLNGTSDNYDYTTGANIYPGSTRVYTLQASMFKLLVAVPDLQASLKEFVITPADNDTEAYCDVKIILEIGGERLIGIWKKVDRKLMLFVNTMKNSGAETEKKIAGYLFFNHSRQAVDTSIDNTIVNMPSEASLYSLCSFLSVVNMGVENDVEAHTLQLKKTQGLETMGWSKMVRRQQISVKSKGSAMFAAYLSHQSDNGYPPAILTDSKGEQTGILQQVGQDGGWRVFPPGNAVKIINKRSGIEIPAVEATKTLAISTGLTLESWLNIHQLQIRDIQYSRVIHANLGEDQNNFPYMMGCANTASLKFLKGTQLQTKDDSVAESEKRLFQSSTYTIQFYIKPDLNTLVDKAGRLYVKSTINADQYEELQASLEGELIFVIKNNGQQTTHILGTKLTDKEWNMVTVVRNGDNWSFYINGQADQKAPFRLSGYTINTFHSLILGGNTHQYALEMEMNLFTVWNNAFAPKEISDQYQKAVAPDALGLLLRWGMDIYQKEDKVNNTATATEGRYNTSVTGAYYWEYGGLFYRVYAAVYNSAVQTRDAVIAGNDWHHIAVVYTPHFGVKLENENYADCGNQELLNVENEISSEAWFVSSEKENNQRVICSKFGKDLENQSYELGITKDNYPYFTIGLSGISEYEGKAVDKNKLFTVTGKDKIVISGEYYIVATAKLSEEIEEVKAGGVKKYFLLEMYIYINGELVGTIFDSNKKMYTNNTVCIVSSTAAFNIGRTKPDSSEQREHTYFYGKLSDLYLWNKVLSAPEVKNHYSSHVLDRSQLDGIIACWTFEEQVGRVGYDKKGDSNATFRDSDMWILYHDNANLILLIDGKEEILESCDSSAFGGFEPQLKQFTIGNMYSRDKAFLYPFLGSLDELRIWNQPRTWEQISDNMERKLSGAESNLVGYWRFDAGSGKIVVDYSVNGNDGKFVSMKDTELPVWVLSDAPVSNEASVVLNALGGVTTSKQVMIDGSPAVIEYSDSQYDSRGNLFSVLKRAYIYKTTDGVMRLITGYKVGDLQMVYLGQIQMKPSLIGYIEGAPPIPSENMTRPYYQDPAFYGSYNNVTSVKLTQEKTDKITINGQRNSGSQTNFAFQIGGGYSGESEAGQFIYKKITKLEAKFLVATNIDWAENETNGKSISSSFHTAESHLMYNCGDWEAPDIKGGFFLQSGERRFIPSNEGYALVKSGSADMYTLLLEDTGTLVGVSVVPNKEIPEDVNIVYFPINPAYVKNGCLDGRIGLQQDPESSDRSYFKPGEAYALKQKIEREEENLRSTYTQFNAAKKGKSHDENLDSVIDNNLLYEWKNNVPKKNMVNTYVWTAAGGLYSEQKDYVSELTESQSGNYDFNWNLGFNFNLETVFAGTALWNETSLLGGTHFSVTVEKQKEQGSALNLEINADPEGFLNKYLGDSDPLRYYTSKPEPGKVDTYRFMTFYLSPNEDNFTHFFEKVVDPLWLNTSNDSRAILLREAKSNFNPTWKVMHRVTFVSRIPPEYQSFPLESQAVDTNPPVNLLENIFILDLVKERVSSINLADTPAPAAIGQAVREVFYKDLINLIPWWKDFLDKAKIENSEEYVLLNSLVFDTIQYVSNYYKITGGKMTGFLKY
ncbi:LamG domain-containing protein [Dysgonomonas macrotermitis]|uniref:Concanavalin A-like lectin/glucanases superfamily protein n=1 Tax=Dysgonomonas macrotermitis TaxID=1346286 RepID=A0A1M5J5K6_9BACT|nr:LamG domain-containing protein [Dysgonomonas macrotermitis]SHG35866.1 Concanavalin A-like lectin/glucanases superfamily protein [Dysgonomonas macrotermitis]